MDLKTNVERVEALLTNVCGCTDKEAILVLDSCLNKYKNKHISKRIVSPFGRMRGR